GPLLCGGARGLKGSDAVLHTVLAVRLATPPSGRTQARSQSGVRQGELAPRNTAGGCLVRVKQVAKKDDD
ncbi:hypothetical protein HaLaN_29221, partial [Haematococcus lacustris]